MSYPKSRDSYPRVVDMIVRGLASRTALPISERKDGDEVFKYECSTPTEAKGLRYSLYGWIDLLVSKGEYDEVEIGKLAKRWKIAAEGNWVICRERESPAMLKRVMAALEEQGML